jgi:uncharacterized protein YndB with AHSA1/START domain
METKNDAATPIVLERTFRAPVEKVWNALIDNEQMKKWYFNLPEFRPEVGFEFRFTGGPSPEKQYEHVCVITEVEPGRKLQYSWRYEGYDGISHVTFLLTPQGDETLLRLTHEGLESFPADVTDFSRSNFEQGWNEIIGTSLKQFLDE